MNQDLHPTAIKRQLAQSSSKCLQNTELYASKQPWLPIYVVERVAPVALGGLRTHPRWKCVQRRCDYDDDDDGDDDDDT